MQGAEDVSSWVEGCLSAAGMRQVISAPRRASGSLELLLRLVRETGRRQMRMVWIDPCDCLDPVTAFTAPPRHLLWARGGGLLRALQVADLVLRDENFPFVCLDGRLLAPSEWKRVPLNRWYRLQRLVHRRGSSLILWTPPVVIPAASQRWNLSARWTFPDCFTAPRGELEAAVSIVSAEERAASGL